MTGWGQIVCNCCHGNQPFTTSTQFEHGSQSGLQRESKSCSYYGDGDLMFSVTMVMEHGDSGWRSVCKKYDRKQTNRMFTNNCDLLLNNTHTHTHLYGCTDSVSGGRGFSERRRSYVEHCTNNELADMRRMSWCCSCEKKHDVFESNMFVCWHNVRTQSLISGQNVVHRDVKIFKLCFTEHSFSLMLWRRSLLTAAEWWSHKLNLICDWSSYSVWYLLWW